MYLIKINDQPVSQLADGHCDTSRTEIIATLDHAAGLGIAEQALYLALRGRVALLHLSAASGQGLGRVLLGRAGGTAAAVTSCTSAYQENYITGFRTLPHNIHLGCRRYDRADFHALGHIALMVNLTHLPRGQTNLIAIGTVAGSRPQRDFLLGQFPRQRFL